VQLESTVPLQVHWCRETASSKDSVKTAFAWDPPEPQPVVDSALLAKAARRRADAGLPESPIELHLPCSTQPVAPPRVYPDGAVVLQDPGAHTACLMTLLALSHEGGPPDSSYLRFADTRTATGKNLAYQLPRMLERYGLPDEAIEWVHARPGAVTASLLLRIPARAALAWRGIAGPRQARFHQQLRPVAASLQESLRVWLPYVFFQDPKVFASPKDAWPMLVYEFLKPFKSEFAADYTYDPHDRAAIHKALWGVIPPLLNEVKRIRPWIAETGVKLPDPFQYSQRRVPPALHEMARVPRRFSQILFAEQQLHENLLRYSEEIHTARKAESSPVPLRMGTQIHSRLSLRLKRAYCRANFRPLAPMILVEATAALAGAEGIRTPVQALLRLRCMETAQVKVLTNPAFSG